MMKVQELEVTQATLKKMLNALEGDDYPRDGIIAHHGVSRGAGRHTVSLTTWEIKDCLAGKLQALVYAKGDWNPFFLQPAIERALGSFICRNWQGGEGYRTGISVILERPSPLSLRTAQKNYRNLPSPFDRSPETNGRFESWSTWFSQRMEALGD